ncbi:src-like-adapter 2 isoform X1 [Equus caballus]|uniref:src-like-adapter 2 isoform X1 n=1 Tax=Equus caballus TaxID=9796 RepID=UPI0038B3C22F
MGSQPSRGKAQPSPSLSPSVQGQGPVTVQPDRSRATAVALGSFPVGEQAELSLRLGEPLTIISENGDWWTVLSEVSGREYSIPSIHVAKISHGWLYEGLSREKAEELLLLPGNPGGAFLIRESQTRRGFRQWRLQGTASPRLAASPRAPQRKFRRVLLGPPPHTHTAPNLILHTTVDPTLPLGIILRTPGKTWGLTPEVPAGQDVTLAKPGRASRNPGPCTLFAFFPVGLPPVPAPSHGSHHSLPRPAFRPTAHQNTQCMNTPCSFHCGILSHNPLSAGKAVSSVPPLHKLTLILHDPFQYRFPRLFVTLCSQVP